MSYIRWENGKLVCNHPEVSEVGESSQTRGVFVTFKSGKGNYFQSLQFANKFLEDLGDQPKGIVKRAGIVQSTISRIMAGEQLIIPLNATIGFTKDEHVRVASSGVWGIVRDIDENNLIVKPQVAHEKFCSVGDNVPEGTLMKNELIIAEGMFSTDGEEPEGKTMDKITEESFGKMIRNADPENKTTTTEECFELAKKLAKSFAWWLVNHHSDFQAGSPDGTYLGSDFIPRTEDELFEMYLNDRNNE